MPLYSGLKNNATLVILHHL